MAVTDADSHATSNFKLTHWRGFQSIYGLNGARIGVLRDFLLWGQKRARTRQRASQLFARARLGTRYIGRHQLLDLKKEAESVRFCHLLPRAIRQRTLERPK
jgi:hypothetical protein